MKEQLKKVIAHHDWWSETYDADYFDRFELYHRITLANIKPFLPVEKDALILDAGGGTGIWSVELAKMGYRVVLTDISKEMLARVEVKVSELKLGDRIETKVSNICHMPEFDDETYVRKFTPRKADSHWSESNRKRVKRLIEDGQMTESGLEKVRAAKVSGKWVMDGRPEIDWNVPEELGAALEKNGRAKTFFEQLPPSCRKRFIAWIRVAKRPETRRKRVKESVALLARGEKLGMK